MMLALVSITVTSRQPARAAATPSRIAACHARRARALIATGRRPRSSLYDDVIAAPRRAIEEEHGRGAHDGDTERGGPEQGLAQHRARAGIGLVLLERRSHRARRGVLAGVHRHVRDAASRTLIDV